MTDTIIEIERIVLEKNNKPGLKIQAAHALSGLVARYIPVIELTEINERIEKLEELINETN